MQPGINEIWLLIKTRSTNRQRRRDTLSGDRPIIYCSLLLHSALLCLVYLWKIMPSNKCNGVGESCYSIYMTTSALCFEVKQKAQEEGGREGLSDTNRKACWGHPWLQSRRSRHTARISSRESSICKDKSAFPRHAYWKTGHRYLCYLPEQHIWSQIWAVGVGIVRINCTK